MKKIFLPILFTSIVITGKSQVLQVDNSLTPAQLVQNILTGSGVQVFNVTFNGDASQIGSFNGTGTNLGFNAGIIMNTGDITNAVGPNNSGSASTSIGGGGDVDLSSIVNGDAINDAAVLEFDFIPNNDSIIFNFIFASEEYLEWVGGYNDAFGFFISGPGITGPYSNNAKNIALIPGTSSPVSINNVNDATNSNFYFNNETPPGQSVQFDGFTIPIQAVSQVQCGETYHLKLAIGDAVDNAYDSGVFLEAGSLSSVGVDISLKTITGDTVIFEGCTPADFIFTRPETQTSNTMVIHYTFSGSATPGVDFTVSPPGDSITFQVGQDSVSLTIATDQIIDGLEGDEILTITATFISECGDTITRTKSLIITEEPIINAISNNPILNCPSDSVLMTIEAIGGTPPYSYNWLDQGGNIVYTGDSVYTNITQTGQTTYTVQISDFCNFSFDTIVTVTLNPKPPLSLALSAPNANCLTPTITISSNGSGGIAPLTYLWSTGETTSSINAPALGNPPPSYTCTMYDACGDSIQATHTVIFDPAPPLNVQVNDTTVKCPNDSVPIDASVLNGNQPFTYTWSNGQTGQSTTIGIQTNGTLSFTVNVVDVCGSQGSATVNVTLDQTLNITNMNSVSTYTCLATGQTSSTIFGETGTVNYYWTGPGSNNTDTVTTATYSNLTTGWYYLYIEDAVCFDKDSVFVDIIADPVANFTYQEPSQDPPKIITFINGSTNATHYFWDFGNSDTLSTNNSNSVGSNYNNTGTYEVMLIAYNGPCSDTTVQTITLLPNPKLNLPNFFSPDNDSKNDLFTLDPKFFSEFTYQIFNRWGNLMFEGDLNNPTWDGKSKSGKEAQDGTYFYTYKGKGINGTELEGHGYVQLVKK